MKMNARTRREAEAHLEIQACATKHMQLCTWHLADDADGSTHIFHMPRRLAQEMVAVATQREVCLRVVVPIEAVVYKMLRTVPLRVVP